MPQVKDDRSPLKLINILRRESGAWFKIAGMIGIVFFSSITMTNWLKNTFDLDVLPFFEPVLDSFQAWSHWVLDITLFRWLELLSGFIIDLVQSVWAMTFKTEIDLPELIVPSWWKDASILSFLLLRSQNGAVSLASPVSLHRMTVEEQHEWLTMRAQSNRRGRRIEAVLWAAVMAVFSISSIVTWPIRRLAGKSIGKLARDTIGGAFLLGALYLAHDLVVAINTRKSDSRFAIGHRRFVTLMTISLVAAFVGAVLFLFVNGALSPTSPK